MREWLTVIIALLIIAVVLDGIRRMRLARRSAIRMSPSIPQGSSGKKSDAFGSELPNGGARVATVRKADDAQQFYQQIRQTREDKQRRLGRPSRIPQQVALNLDEQVPTLMEVEQEERNSASVKSATDGSAKADRSSAGKRRASAKRHEPAAPEREPLDDIMDFRDDERIEPQLSESLEFSESHQNITAEDSVNHEGNEFASEPLPDTDEQLAWESPVESEHPDEQRPEEDDFREPEDVLVINVMAPKGERFRGDALLKTVLEQGMRFGSMNIFHHHEHFNGDGGILYSMANIVVPGTFDLASMKDFSTPGVSLFLALPVDGDSSRAFETMLTTAKALANNLGGELKDENRSVMTGQTAEHYRSRVKEFERKRLSKKAPA